MTRTKALILSLAALSVGSVCAQEPPRLKTEWRYGMPAGSDAGIAATDQYTFLSDSKGNATALQTTSGKELWTVKLPSGGTAPASVSENLVLFGTRGGELCAFTHGGDARWTAKSEGQVVGAPLILGDAAVFGSYDSRVYSVDLSSGKERWQFQTGAQVHAPVVALNDLVLVAGCDTHLRAIDSATGKEKWSVELSGAVAAAPLVQGNSVFVATLDASVYRIDAAGNIAWQRQLPDAGQLTRDLVVLSDRLQVVSDDGQLFSLEASSGEIDSTTKLAAGPSAMCSLADHLLIGTDEGRILVLDSKGRSVSRITLGGTINRLVVVGEKVLASTDKGVAWLLQ